MNKKWQYAEAKQWKYTAIYKPRIKMNKIKYLEMMVYNKVLSDKMPRSQRKTENEG